MDQPPWSVSIDMLANNILSGINSMSASTERNKLAKYSLGAYVNDELPCGQFPQYNPL